MCELAGGITIAENEDYLLLLVRYMARDGIDKADIMKRLSISSKKYNSIVARLKDTPEELSYLKMITDYEVEDKLLKKALGGVSTEAKKTQKASGTEIVETTKEVPADTAAIKLWLEHRCPNKWGDKSLEATNINQRLSDIFEAINKKADELIDNTNQIPEKTDEEI